MKKDCTRDYVTECFRKYFAANMRSYEQEKKRIYSQAIQEARGLSGETAIIHAETEVAKKYPYLMDIAAAQATFDILKKGGRSDIVDMIKAVYCAHPNIPVTRGEIVDRVRNFAMTNYMDDSTVYRQLKRARFLCAAIRGLSIPENETEDIQKHYGEAAYMVCPNGIVQV